MKFQLSLKQLDAVKHGGYGWGGVISYPAEAARVRIRPRAREYRRGYAV